MGMQVMSHSQIIWFNFIRDFIDSINKQSVPLLSSKANLSCPADGRTNQDCTTDDDEDEGIAGQDEAVPALQRQTTHQQTGKQVGAGRNHQVRKAITALEGKYRHLPGNPQYIGQRRHDRHYNGRLTRTGRNKEVNKRIDDEHTDGSNTFRHTGQR